MEELSIEERLLIAYHRTGKWLLRGLASGKPALFWECPNGHRWKATLNSFEFGTTCPICHHRED